MTDIIEPLAYLHGKPTAKANIKTQVEDFQVTEILGFDFSGSGEHLMLQIQKQGENTSYVANELAKACGVASKNVGWAGLKDRHATTEQWLSIHLPKEQQQLNIDAFEAQHPGVRILQTTRHHKKLRPGELQGNHFVIRLREVSDIEQVESRLQQITLSGVPNYYGAQRFGREGKNLSEARRWGRDNVRTRNQNQRSLYLSTARSWIFNQIVSHRIQTDTFHQVIDGDILQSSTQESILVDKTVMPLASYSEQVALRNLVITAALAGDNALPTLSEARELETLFLDQEPDLMALIRGNRMRHDRRAMVVYPHHLEWKIEQQDIIVSFSLAAGCFATTVLREVAQLTEKERVY